jgi:uncharacterized membrane protein YebE (DUF533 family)
MLNLNNIVQGLSRSGAVSGFAGGLAGTAVAGALMGKKGRKMAKSALKLGGMAAVGGLAYAAYQQYQQGQAPTPTPVSGPAPAASGASTASARWEHIDRERFESVVAETNARSGGLLLVRAMIAAATADGHMDQGEQARIFDKVQSLDLAPEEKAALFDELRHPLALDQLVAQVSDPETSVEVYAASLVAIDETRAEGQAYLRRLAAALELPENLVAAVHQQADLARRDRAA